MNTLNYYPNADKENERLLHAVKNAREQEQQKHSRDEWDEYEGDVADMMFSQWVNERALAHEAEALGKAKSFVREHAAELHNNALVHAAMAGVHIVVHEQDQLPLLPESEEDPVQIKTK